MNKETKIEIKKWKKMARMWKGFAKPGRPSQRDIFLMNQLVGFVLKGQKKPKVLVLGVTPEIRDMLYKYSLVYNAEVSLLDMNKEMYYAMNEFLDYKNNREKFVLGNWIYPNLKENYFDLIIGDLAIGNIIGLKPKNLFLQKMNSLLKKDGFFITRDSYILESLKIKNVKELFMKHATDIMAEKETIKTAANIATISLLGASWFRNKKQRTSISYFKKDIKSLKKDWNKKKVLSQKEKIGLAVFNKFLETWWHMRKKYWHYLNKKEFETLYSAYFKIEKKLFARDYDTSYVTPILLLKQRKK